MATIVERRAQDPEALVFVCDFSPPRGADVRLLDRARELDADFISLAYNPGRSVRVASALAATWIRQNTGRDVLFTLSTRDMNKVALQSLLLGADLLGLENVVVVMGDEFTDKDLTLTRAVHDLKPTELLRSIGSMNEGVDFKGLKLRVPTNLCVGATIDLAHGPVRETRLTRKKVESGARFFLMQPVAGPAKLTGFLEGYSSRYGEDLAVPVFVGVQVMTPDGLFFGELPARVKDDLAAGRPGNEIAAQAVREFAEAGFRSIYLIPPILKGGRRDYEVTQRVLAEFKG